MTSYELAIDVDGEPFAIPPEVTGWRVRRALEGKGQPELIYKYGKPLIVRVNASHADVLAAAGAGKYRLDPVDALGHVVADVKVACTGPLSEDEGPPTELSSSPADPAARRLVAVLVRATVGALGRDRAVADAGGSTYVGIRWGLQASPHAVVIIPKAHSASLFMESAHYSGSDYIS